MKSFFAAAVVVICISGAMPAADQQLIGLMMPEAKVLGGMNIAQVRTSPYGQFVLAKMPLGQAEFQRFVQATGFDPTRDLIEVVAASAGVPGDKSGLAAFRGAFDIGQIVTFVETTGGKVEQVQGVPVLASPDGQMTIALLDRTLAIAGDTNNVLAAISRKSAPSTLDPGLAAKAAALSGSSDAWAVTTISPGSAGPPPGAPAGLNLAALQNIQQSSAGVKFGTTVNLTAEVVTDTPQNANALADVVRLLVNLGQMSQSNPQAAQFVSLLKNLSIQTKGTAIELSLAIPEETIEQLSPPHGAHAVRKTRQAR